MPEGDGESNAVDSIELLLPAQPRYARLARLAASDLASIAGFDVDDLEDLRTAVSELFSVLVDEPRGGDSVELKFEVDQDRVKVWGSRASDDGAPELDPIAKAILAVVVDEVSLEGGGGRHSFHLAKKATQDA